MFNLDNPYLRQVALIIELLPLVREETCFALKGGTAINLFVRDQNGCNRPGLYTNATTARAMPHSMQVSSQYKRTLQLRGQGIRWQYLLAILFQGGCFQSSFQT